MTEAPGALAVTGQVSPTDTGKGVGAGAPHPPRATGVTGATGDLSRLKQNQVYLHHQWGLSWCCWG